MYKFVMNCHSVKSCEVQRGWVGIPVSLEVVREKVSLGPKYGKLTGRESKKGRSRYKEMI